MKISHPLGVDILEWKKARAFYDRHSGKIASMLAPSERRFVNRTRRPDRAFAMIFAAQEAAFKAVGKPCRILPRSAERFEVLNHPQLEGILRETRRHVVACCHALQSPRCAGTC